MGGAGEHGLCHVLLAPCHALDASAAAVLNRVCVGGDTLDIAEVRHGEHAGLLGDKILYIDLAADVFNDRAAVVAELLGNGAGLLADYSEYPLLVRENIYKVGYLRLELSHLVLDLYALESGQLAESHLDYRLRLNFVEPEAVHERLASLGDAL